ncbi:MAG: hypothetical protein ACK4N5_10185, partial [Myxococcales bacterium]
IAGVIAISGPYDVQYLGNSLFLGLGLVIPAFGPSKETWRAVSPATHLTSARPPPFLVAWADTDPALLHRDARKFSEALRRAGVEVETFEAPLRGHLSVITGLGAEGDELGDVVVRYVTRPRGTQAAR